MEVPLEITYRNVEKSEDIDQLIREKAAKLDGMHDRITSCRVSVEKPQEHQRSGNNYRVRIDMRVPPGKELVVRREAGEGDMHDPLRSLITEAFKKISKQLKKVKGKQQETGKPTSRTPSGQMQPPESDLDVPMDTES
ncbi:MAG: HPF/RaiA family ribosome-associated protein [Desulfobacteraceae bacterium]|nr:HPF/RaiA family ribosome-associated protein [Desulfobacteraceae bacterium]